MIIKTAIINRLENLQLEKEELKKILADLGDVQLILFSPIQQKLPTLNNYANQNFRKNISEEKRMFSELAAEFSVFLSPGAFIDVEKDRYCRRALLFNPKGKLILQQGQVFLSEKEKELGLVCDNRIEIVETELGRLGFMVGTDCWKPEVGRFLTLEGVDIILAPTFLVEGNCWKQLAGVWTQVQQNQVFALEAITGGLCMLHGPCEITPYKTGIIAPVGQKEESEAGPQTYLHSIASNIRNEKKVTIVEGQLNTDLLRKIRNNYPIRKFLNPRLYQKSGLDNLV